MDAETIEAPVAEATVADDSTPETQAEAGESGHETSLPANAAASKAPAIRTLAELVAEGASDEEIMAAIDRESGIEPSEDEAPEAISDGESEVENGEQAGAEETPETDDATAEAVAELKPGSPKRIKPSDPKIVELNDLVRSGVPLTEAIARLNLSPQAAAAVQPVEEAKQAETRPADETLDDLKAQYAEARRSFDTDRELELHDKILTHIRAGAKGDALAELDARRETAVMEREERANMATVLGAAPDFLKEGTPLGDAASKVAAAIEKTNKAFFTDPKWPQKLMALAWVEAHPEKAMPALRKAAPAANPPPATLSPRKTGRPAGALASGNRAQGSSLQARALRPDATQADIEAAANEAAALEARAGRRNW